ncbi:importin subunit alpha-8 [Anaeramoeba flamelloides]|uniref:Importin subunit alpha n=1 Tax=Anaeramoeba flamelloides TaxID=1746091 RepID=A0ABQ8XY95_9EUKA|nr:importin subunit alpha-8 [Anaeramoeba flamelloides]
MNFQKKLIKRKEKYKNTSTRDSSRDKRIEMTIKISKDKRENRLRKRRNLVQISQQKKIETSTDQDEIPPVEDLPIFIEQVKSEELDVCYQGTRAIRLLLSEETDPPIDLILESGAPQYIAEFLLMDDYHNLQFESTWAISNLCSDSTSQTKQIVDLGVIPKFVDLISSPDIRISEQAMWGLANIAGDNTLFRDRVLEQKNIIQNISNVFSRKDITINVAKTASWALSNLVEGVPRPKLELVKDVVPIFKMLLNEDSLDLVIDACWAFSKICQLNKEIINIILASDIIPIFVDYLSAENISLKEPSIRIIGALLSGNHLQTEKVLEYQIIDPLKVLISDKSVSIRYKAIWAISNITAGSLEQIKKILTCGIIPLLVTLFKFDINPIKKEICWALSNVVYSEYEENLRLLIKEGVCELFGESLSLPYVEVVQIALESIIKLLKFGKAEAERTNSNYNEIAKKIIEINAAETIDNLQDDENKLIKSQAQHIIANYLSNNEEDVDVDQLNESGENKNTYEF